MTRETHRLSSVTLGWLALALCAGCSSDSVTGPRMGTPTPTPVPVRTTVAEGSSTLPAPTATSFFFRGTTFETSDAGELVSSVDWTFAKNTVFVYLIEDSCTSEDFASEACVTDSPSCPCVFVAMDESASKPKEFTAPDVAAGFYVLVVMNLGPEAESYSYRVDLLH